MTWIRLDTDWQHDPYVKTLDGITRHVLSTIWCIAGHKGVATWGEDNEPEHAVLPLQFIDPSHLAGESGFSAKQVRKALERLRAGVPATEYRPEMPPALLIDAASGEVTVRNVGKIQRKLLRDRRRKQEHERGDSAEGRRPSPKVAALPGELGTNVTNVTNEETTKSPKPATPLPCEPQRVRDVWNERCPPVLPKVLDFTDKRRTSLVARLRKSEARVEAWWVAYFAKILATPFLCGENDRGWRADFDFAIREESIAKVHEGKYDRAPPRPTKPTNDLTAKLRSEGS